MTATMSDIENYTIRHIYKMDPPIFKKKNKKKKKKMQYDSL